MPKTYAGIYQEYLKTCEKQGGTFSPNTLRSDFIKNGFEVKDLNSFERLVLFMNYLSDGFPDLAEKFNAQLQIDRLGEYGPMQEKAMMMMLEENIIHSNTDFINEVLVDPEVEKHFRDKGLQNLYETTAAMIGGKELEQLKNKDKKEPEISADRERQPEPRPDTGEKREEKEPEQPAAAERQPDRKSEEIAADMREKDLPVGEDKWRKIGETLCADEPTRMYYYGALKTVLRQVGMTEEELRVNNSERFKNTRSSEFYNMIHPVCMALDNLKDGSYGNIAGQLKILKTGCINYLNKYPKVRSTQSGRDCYEAALNLLATCADPNDPEVKACIDGVNAKRGLANRPSAKDHIDLRNYGPDRLLGRKKGAADLLKETDKALVEQAKLAKRGDPTASAEVKRLQLKKLYIKASVAPNNAAYPDQLDNTVSVLAANTELNRVLAEAAKDPKRQEQIMAAEVNKLAGRRERNDFYEKAPGAPQAQNGEPKKEKDPSARERLGEFFNI